MKHHMHSITMLFIILFLLDVYAHKGVYLISFISNSAQSEQRLPSWHILLWPAVCNYSKWWFCLVRDSSFRVKPVSHFNGEMFMETEWAVSWQGDFSVVQSFFKPQCNNSPVRIQKRFASPTELGLGLGSGSELGFGSQISIYKLDTNTLPQNRNRF